MSRHILYWEGLLFSLKSEKHRGFGAACPWIQAILKVRVRKFWVEDSSAFNSISKDMFRNNFCKGLRTSLLRIWSKQPFHRGKCWNKLQWLCVKGKRCQALAMTYISHLSAILHWRHQCDHWYHLGPGALYSAEILKVSLTTLSVLMSLFYNVFPAKSQSNFSKLWECPYLLA